MVKSTKIELSPFLEILKDPLGLFVTELHAVNQFV
jgi:hypothetical protein